MQRNRLIGGLFLAFGAIALGAGETAAQTKIAAKAKAPFDGAWAVTIMTEKGTCDAAYRYAVLVSDGKVVSDARESTGTINVSGKIDPEGNVSVAVRRGQQHAEGTGKMSEAGGTGTWSGKSQTSACTGRWEARRNDLR
jgi:hypothetical protein